MKIKLDKNIIFATVLTLIIFSVWVYSFFLIDKEKQNLLQTKLEDQTETNPSNEWRLFGQEEISKLNNYFLTASSTITLLDKLESLGRETKIKLVIGQAEERDGQLILSLSEEADYQSLTKFLEALEKLPYAARVERLSLRKGERTWRGDFSLVILQAKNNN